MIHRSTVQITMNRSHVVVRIDVPVVLVHEVTNLVIVSQPVEALDYISGELTPRRLGYRRRLIRFVANRGMALSGRTGHGSRPRWILFL